MASKPASHHAFDCPLSLSSIGAERFEESIDSAPRWLIGRERPHEHLHGSDELEEAAAASVMEALVLLEVIACDCPG